MARSALVTGGAGFIGSHIVTALLDRGWSVRVMDDLSTGLKSNVDRRAEFQQASILDVSEVSKAAKGVEVLFHVAASVSVPYSVEEPRKSFEINAVGTLNVLEACRSAGVGTVVYSSSSAAYGDTPESPKHEGLAPSPLSPYAAGKLAGEHLVSSYANSFGISAVSLRYFNVFGPRQRPDSPYAAVIPIFLSRIMAGKPLTVYGDGEQTRDFTYVSNVVEANLLASDADLRGEVVNIACGEEVSLNELIGEMKKLSGRSVETVYEDARVGDVKYSVASNELASRVLGYRPTVTWREGLSLLLKD